MQLKPFKDLIALSKEKLDEVMAPARAKLIQSKANLQMVELENKILEKESKAQELCTQKDIDFDKLFYILDEVALLERRHKQYTDVLLQLFPEGVK